MIFTSIFTIIIGLGMIAYWSIALAFKQVPEINDEPIRITFHIVAEIITAVMLIISGVCLSMNVEYSIHIFLLSIGMLLYTLITSPGYFAQFKNYSMVIIFVTILILSIYCIINVIQFQANKDYHIVNTYTEETMVINKITHSK